MNDILSHNSFNPRGMANGGSAFGIYSPGNVGSPSAPNVWEEGGDMRQ